MTFAELLLGTKAVLLVPMRYELTTTGTAAAKSDFMDLCLLQNSPTRGFIQTCQIFSTFPFW